MGDPQSYTLSRYLNAKKSVDDRALNERVQRRFVDELVKRADSEQRARVVEIGVGNGGASERLLSKLVAKKGERQIEYVMVDQNAQLLAEACRRLKRWAEEIEESVTIDTAERTDTSAEVMVRTAQADAFTYLRRSRHAFTAVIAFSFADLVNPNEAVQQTRNSLKEGGIAYFAINPTGETSFLPEFQNPDFDRRVESAYHKSMVRSTPSGPTAGARTGQQLLRSFSESPFQLLETGASDWIVFPRQGRYPADEAYFLHHILHFVEGELQEDESVRADLVDEWVDTRHHQVNKGDLIYIGGHLDLLAAMS